MNEIGRGWSPGESDATRMTRLPLEEWMVKGSVWPKESEVDSESEREKKRREQQALLQQKIDTIRDDRIIAEQRRQQETVEQMTGAEQRRSTFISRR